MKLENSFSVRAPIDQVWAALLDVERVAPCVPGARLLEQQGDDVYELELDVAVGAGSVCYRGRVEILEREAGDRRAVLSVSAAEAAGDGRAEARLVMSVVDQGNLTEGTLATDLSLSGEAAAGESGAIRGVSERLIDAFARNLATMLGGGVPTVNGADHASSTVHAPVSVGEAPRSRPMVVGSAAAAAAAPAHTAEPALEPEPGPGQARVAPPIAAESASSGEGSWAGASRQAGATIERLRSPVVAMLLALVLLAALLGRRRRAGDPDRAGSHPAEPASDPPPEPAD